MPLPRVQVLVPAYDCFEYLTKCLATVAAQDHVDMHVTVIDDCSPDERQREMVESVNRLPGWTGRVNENRQYCPRNIWDLVQLAAPEPDDILFLLDGDDWLPDSTTISRVAAIYEDPDVWMTVGGYAPSPPDPGCHMPVPYPDEVIRNNTFRTYGLHEFNHPLTMKAWLFADAITDADFRFDDGSWMTGGYDQAVVFPCIERAGQHYRCIQDDVLYSYRSDSPVADAIIHREEVLSASDVIRSRPPKPPIDPLPSVRGRPVRRGASRPVRVRRP